MLQPLAGDDASGETVGPAETMAGAPEEPPVDALPGAAGRSRRRRLRQAAIVVCLALVSAGVGVAVGRSIKSPADAASSAKPPTASLITVPVERRELVSSLAISGGIEYIEPVSVRLAGAVGASAGDKQIVTRLPEVGTEVTEGLVLFEISGRPVFALTGELPMYRELGPGSKGPDVLQLETALAAVGFPPGAVDDLYDSGTEAALDGFYAAHGYTSQGATDDQRKQLTEARKAVADADAAVRQAQVALSNGKTTVTASERLAKTLARDKAATAVTDAQTAADRNNAQAAADVATARSLSDNAKASYAAQVAILTAAQVVDAINPETGAAYTPGELAALQQAVLDKDRARLEAEQTYNKAVTDQAAVLRQGQLGIDDANGQLLLAQSELNDLDKPADTSALRDAVTAANGRLDEAKAALTQLEAQVGTVLPAGEVVFLPHLPIGVNAVNAQLGAPPPGDAIAQVSSTETEITGGVSKADAALLTVGSPVTIEVPDLGVTVDGTLKEIRKPKADSSGGGTGSGDGSGASDRLEVVVTASDSSQLQPGYGVRIGVTVSSTAGEVLAVPVAAVFVGPDGNSQVEVERTPAIADKPAVTALVSVEVGLSAQGYIEIAPRAGEQLVEGDRVVVGSETSTRRKRRTRTTDTSVTDASATEAGTESTTG
ncbi:MAG: peptidoglycan-binding domain-containing protein [Ilumatobacteraceae bacterium]